MATAYVEELYRAQPEGPYALGGWSFGAIVAFEMAQQLHGQGREVALLALLDRPNLSALKEQTGQDDTAVMLGFAQDLGIPRQHLLPFLDLLPQLDADDQLRLLLDRGNTLDTLPVGLELPELRRHFQIFKANVLAADRYVAQRYPGKLHLFRAGEQPHGDSSDPTMGWADLAAGGVEVHMVPGSHFTMVREPHVRVLAEELSKCLELSMPSRKTGFASVSVPRTDI
jgi:thioesterase domain-containing protein